MRALVLLVLFTGCAVDGRALPDWRLHAGSRDVPVALPSTLFGELGMQRTDYRLTANVTLSPAERGHPLTLVIGCLHEPLVVTANGTPLTDQGDAVLMPALESTCIRYPRPTRRPCH